MFLSIVIPCYNVEKYIVKCLDSVYSQNVNDEFFEVIIVNDGSPDRSVELAEPYIKNHSNCSLINQMNGGLSVARNKGLENAKGDYVWFVDSDDWLMQGSLCYVLFEIQNNPSVDIFASSLLLHNEETKKEIGECALKNMFVSGVEYFEKGYPYGAAPRSIYKRKFLIEENIRFAPGLLHEDGMWGFQVYYCAKNIKLLDKHIYVYLQRTSGSIMKTIKVKSAYDLVEIHKRLYYFMKNRVAKEHQEYYERKIINVLCAAYAFTRPIWDTNEFRMFEKENLSYIRKMALCSCFVKGGWKKGIPMLLNPKLLFFLAKWK